MEESSLTKTVRSLRSEFAVFFLIFMAISLIAYLGYTFVKGPTQKYEGVAFDGKVFPGQTTKDQVESKLGEPKDTKNENGVESYLYETENKFRLNEVDFSEGVVSIVKEQVIRNEKGNLKDYRKKLGPEEAKVYGRHSTYAPGFFWGSKGLLVFANEYDGGIVEIWYFKPTSKDDFLQSNPSITSEVNHKEELIQP